MAGLGEARPTPYAVSWYLTPEVGLALLAGVVGSTPIVPALAAWRARLGAGGPRRLLPGALDRAATAALVLLLVVSVTQVAARAYNPFIYFRF